MINPFKNSEFETLFSKVKEDVKLVLDNYQDDKESKLEVEEIVMWQRFQNGNYIVIPTEKCPNQIKDKVLSIISKYNPTTP